MDARMRYLRDQARQVYKARDEALLHRWLRHPQDFTCDGNCNVPMIPDRMRAYLYFDSPPIEEDTW